MINQSINFPLIKQEYELKSTFVKRRIIVCAGTGCIANGARKLFDELSLKIKEAGLNLLLELKFEKEKKDNHRLSESGCQGFCQMGPLVTILPDDILYTKVTVKDVDEIVNETLLNNKVVERLLYRNSDDKPCKGYNEIPFYNRQKRTVLKECGLIDPSDINEYIAHDGYSSAEKAILEWEPAAICEMILSSGLRGRGGGGFPAGLKWKLTLKEQSEKKYIICNGDEGDPGAFMDRSVMEGNPHSVIEGMIIAARAIGADEGIVYVRAEYPLAVKRIRKAVKDAEKLGILGKNILGSSFSFTIDVMEGAGAFVCGEETALIASVEGQRGMPSPKPPFPAQKGLYEKPTVINNVETLASVPVILRMGPEKYRSMGTPKSPGTKTFALTGHVINTGLIEVPLGVTLREIVYNIGGGVTNDDGSIAEEGFKGVQIGGPSGGCLTKEHLDLPLDFDSLKGIGAMVGSGGLVVMNHNTCMVQMARFFMQFTQNESCGKCVLCREGTKQMLGLLDDIIEGNANDGTLELLLSLANAVQKGSLCGLGKTAPNPILGMVNQFKDEYMAHVRDKKCPAKKCKSLAYPVIDPVLCKGCQVCKKSCPTNAITGDKKQVHVIDETLCIKCGACITACKLKAVA